MLFDERLYYTKFSGKTKKSPLSKVGKQNLSVKRLQKFYSIF